MIALVPPPGTHHGRLGSRHQELYAAVATTLAYEELADILDDCGDDVRTLAALVADRQRKVLLTNLGNTSFKSTPWSPWYRHQERTSCFRRRSRHLGL
jgi:hypothetical protein